MAAARARRPRRRARPLRPGCYVSELENGLPRRQSGWSPRLRTGPRGARRRRPPRAPPLRTSSGRSRPAAPPPTSTRSCPPVDRPASLPWRRIEMRSPSESASWSLCVMKITPWPCSFSRTSTFVSSATPCGVSIEVGSSSMSTREPRQSALMISTCCWCPSARSSCFLVGSTSTAELLGELTKTLAGARPRRAEDCVCRRASGSRARSASGMSVECWETVPIPWTSAWRGESIETSRPADPDRARIRRRTSPERIPIRRRLAGAVLAEEAVNLAAADAQCRRRRSRARPGRPS